MILREMGPMTLGGKGIKLEATALPIARRGVALCWLRPLTMPRRLE
jgi:hypothetical protein